MNSICFLRYSEAGDLGEIIILFQTLFFILELNSKIINVIIHLSFSRSMETELIVNTRVII